MLRILSSICSMIVDSCCARCVRRYGQLHVVTDDRQNKICRPASPFPTGPTLTVKRRCANVAGLNRSSLLAKKQPTLPFEDALKELEALGEKMEHGELSLEESLRYFDRGVALTRQCQQALQEAEQKAEILLEKGEQTDIQPFADDT